jgi:formate dehydrogenase maturation protein FdhE
VGELETFDIAAKNEVPAVPAAPYKAPSQPSLIINDNINLYCSTCQAWSPQPAVKRVTGKETCQQCGALYNVVTQCTKCNSQGIITVDQFNEFRANPSRCDKCQAVLKVM